MSDYSPIDASDCLFIGEDKILQFTVRDKKGGAGNLVDVAGWTVEFVVRRTATSNDVLLSLTTGGGEITMPAPTTDGIIVVTLSRANTLLLSQNKYVYALRRTDAGESQVLAQGELITQWAATR